MHYRHNDIIICKTSWFFIICMSNNRVVHFTECSFIQNYFISLFDDEYIVTKMFHLQVADKNVWSPDVSDRYPHQRHSVVICRIPTKVFINPALQK